MGILSSLRDSLGFTKSEVATVSGWSEDHLTEIESLDDADEITERRLSDLYGVDVGFALCTPDAPVPLPPVAALLKSNDQLLSAGSRFAIAEAVTVARTIRKLQGLLDVTTGWRNVEAFGPDMNYDHPRHGGPERLALSVREALSLGEGPVLSVQEDLLDPLGVLVLQEDLPDAVDAFCMATPETGAVIVMNRQSKHATTAFGRRITAAHELCHILFDRHRMLTMKRFCTTRFDQTPRRPARDEEDDIERRARAFSVWLLAPRAAVLETWNSSNPLHRLVPSTMVRRMMEKFGIGYTAARGHLQNVNLLHLKDEIGDVDPSTPDIWERRDPLPPLNPAADAAGVQPLRSGPLLDWLLRAYESQLISESYLQQELRLDWSAWQTLRGELGLPAAGTWRAASAQPAPRG